MEIDAQGLDPHRNLCNCDPSKSGWIKDTVCAENDLTNVFFGFICALSIVVLMLGFVPIVQYLRRPFTSASRVVMCQLFFLFQVTLLANAAFSLDIVFHYGRTLYFLFYYMTQAYYFALLAYLYTCYVFCYLLAISFLVSLIIFDIQFRDQLHPQHHPFHIPSAAMSFFLLLSFLVIGVPLQRRFKRKFRVYYSMRCSLSIAVLIFSGMACIMFGLIYEAASGISPSSFYDLRQDNCNDSRIGWSFVMLIYYLTRSLPILLFYVYLICRFSQLKREETKIFRESFQYKEMAEEDDVLLYGTIVSRRDDYPFSKEGSIVDLDGESGQKS